MPTRDASAAKATGWGEVGSNGSSFGGGGGYEGDLKARKVGGSPEKRAGSLPVAGRGNATGPIHRSYSHDKKDSTDDKLSNLPLSSAASSSTPARISATNRRPSIPPLPSSRLPFTSASSSASSSLPNPYSTRPSAVDGGPRTFGHKLSNSIAKPLHSISDTLSGTPLANALPSSSASVLATIKFSSLCSLWYTSSAVSSNTAKSIFSSGFKFPVTLTLVQFAFIALYCFLWTRPILRMAVLREPTKALVRGVLPMAAFQVFGHVFSSVATSRVPVSTVHTIKALSPLFTVLSYRFLFNVSYSSSTYIALIPLTLGVMFACSFDVSGSNLFGLICAFGSTLIFVSSNIFFKKIVPSTSGSSTASGKDGQATTNARLDKINLLFYSSSLAFTFMIPLFLYNDFLPLLSPNKPKPIQTQRVLYYFLLNGTSHFAQNVLAFAILSSTSPVTYSIASLIKRIVVIVMAILWFRQSVHPIQALGITLTFVGLYMYQNAKGEVEKVEKKVRKMEAIREGSFLPTSQADNKLMNGDAKYDSLAYSPSNTFASSIPRNNDYSNNDLHHTSHHHPPPPPPPPRKHAIPA